MWPQLIAAALAIIDKVIPDPTAKAAAQFQLMALQQNGELAQLDAVKALSLAQLEVNKVDAAGAPMQRNWRPFIGWVCGIALAWDTIGKPVFLLVWAMNGHAAPVLPNLSTEQLYGLLFGLLGLGGLRTVEKVKAAA